MLMQKSETGNPSRCTTQQFGSLTDFFSVACFRMAGAEFGNTNIPGKLGKGY
jgi:hypothetical protein